MMKINIIKAIDRNEWLKALNVKGKADDMLSVQMEICEKKLLDVVRPRGIYRIMQRDEFKTLGTSIEHHLTGCEKVALIAVTLGNEVDELIRKTQILDMAAALIMDCGASILVEQLADEFQKSIREEFQTIRFSPGYGDYPLSEQKRVAMHLDTGRKIGLNITRDYLMVPRKSITGVIGISDRPVAGVLATCNECVLKDKCELRRKGKNCGNKL